MSKELRGFDENALVGSEGQSDIRLEVARLTTKLAASRAREAKLREALQSAGVGGNHLAHVLIKNLGAGFAGRFPPDMDHEQALRELCATDNYDIWCCWSALMNARAALSASEDSTD